MTAKKQIITIAGRPGSGKSTTAKGVAAQLGFKHFSSGDLFREASKKAGVDVLQSNLAAEEEEGVPAIDYLVDQKLREIGETEDMIVIDSRTAWHWIPGSFKVFLDLDLKIAAERILSAMTEERKDVEQIADDIEEYAKSLGDRLSSETRRYKKLYDIDPYQNSNYDLVVDTNKNGIDAAIKLVVEAYNGWLKN